MIVVIAALLVITAWALVAGVALEYRRAIRLRRAFFVGLRQL